MILALEGGICSGKTTLAKELSKHSFLMVPEYMDFITKEEQLELDYLQKSKQSALPLLLNIEKRRQKEFLDKSVNLVLDRSYLTLLAFEYAKNNDDCHNLLKNKDLLKEVINPDIIIFLDIDTQTRKDRCYDRGDFDMPSFYLDEKFNQKNKEFFQEKIDYNVVFFNTLNINPQKMANMISRINNTQNISLDNFILQLKNIKKY